MLVDLSLKLEMIGYKRVTFEHCRFHWSSLIPNGTVKMKLAIAALLYCWEIVKTIGFFTNTHNWQCWHCCQLCIPIYLEFPFYLHHMRLVNVKLDVSGCRRIIFQGCTLDWRSSLLMTQLK